MAPARSGIFSHAPGVLVGQSISSIVIQLHSNGRRCKYPTRYGRWDEAIRLFTPDSAPKSGYDLIGIGTPPDSHMELALRALEEKPNAILIEKPVCTPALEYANDLLSIGKARGCLLFVGYDHVVGTAANRFCELIDQNVMGKPLTLDVEFREHWAGILAAHPWLDGPADSYPGFGDAAGCRR